MKKTNKTETDNKIVSVSNPETAKVSETKTAKVEKVSPSIVIDANDETALIAEGAKVLKAEKSISAIKKDETYTRYSTIYGGNVWKQIFARIKDIRKAEISRIGEKVKSDFLNYSDCLKHEYKRLDGNKDFRTLCGFIGDKDIRNWFKGADEFVATFYPNVIDGNPATLISYVYKDGFVLKAYQPRELSAINAVSVLNSSVSSAISSARNRVKLVSNGKDLKDNPVRNNRISGAIVSAFFLNPDGTIGEKINPDNKVYPSLMKVNVSNLETLTEYRKRVSETNPETANK